MILSIWFEIIKIRAQKKNWIVIAGFFLLMTLLWVGFHFTAQKMLGGSLDLSRVDLPMDELKKIADGFFFARAAIYPLFCILMPIYACMLCGDSIASEIQEGNLKLYFARGFSRTQLVVAKFLTNYLYILFFSLVFGLGALLIGVVSFGISPLQVCFHAGGRIGTFLVFMGPGQAFVAYVASLVYLSFGITAIGSVSFLLSSVFNRMTIPTVGGLMIYFVSFILSIIPMTENLAPYLITRAIDSDSAFYMNPVPFSLLIANLTLSLIYCLFGIMVPILVLNGKDIR